MTNVIVVPKYPKRQEHIRYQMIVDQLPKRMVNRYEDGTFTILILGEKEDDLLQNLICDLDSQDVKEYVEDLGFRVCEECGDIFNVTEYPSYQPEEVREAYCLECIDDYRFCEDLQCPMPIKDLCAFEDGIEVTWWSEDGFSETFSWCESCEETYFVEDVFHVQIYCTETKDFVYTTLCVYCLNEYFAQSYFDRGTDKFYPKEFLEEVGFELVTPYEMLDEKKVGTCVITDELYFADELEYVQMYGLVSQKGRDIIDFKKNPVFEGYKLIRLEDNLWGYLVGEYMVVQHNAIVALHVPNYRVYASADHNWQDLLDFAFEFEKYVPIEENLLELCYMYCCRIQKGVEYNDKETLEDFLVLARRFIAIWGGE